MDYLGLDIAKAKFDAALITSTRTHRARFDNSQAGFDQLAAWLARHSPCVRDGLHACMEATGNWGLDLAAFLFEAGITVSIVNPRQIKSFGDSELVRNKTDPMDAALIARFCRAHAPRPWTPPLPGMRELREMVRRCAALKASRTQEANRQKAGLASAGVAASVTRMLAHLDAEIAAVSAEIRVMIARTAELQASFDLLCSIPGLGEVTAAIILAELPNITEFSPKALAAFAGLSPQEDSSGNRKTRRGISRVGNASLRAALFMAALSARRHNPALQAFVERMISAAKPKKVILIAVARRLLVIAHAVLRAQKPFQFQAATA